MAETDDQLASPAPPGSMAAILADLVLRDGRSQRKISVDAGLSPDAIRNCIRLPESTPRRKTMMSLARTLGVSVGVLTGDEPIPDNGGTRPLDVVEPLRKGSDVHRMLRVSVRDALRRAVAGGMEADQALAEAVGAAMMAGVSAGLDDIEAAEIVGRLGLAK